MTDIALNPPPCEQTELGELRRFTRTGLPGDDDDLMVAQHLGDLVLPGGNRQVRVEGRPRHGPGPLLAEADRSLDMLAQAVDLVLCGPTGAAPGPQPAKSAAQTKTVGEHGRVDTLGKLGKRVRQ